MNRITKRRTSIKAFDFPSVATEKKKAKEKNKKPVTTKGNTVKEEKEDQKFAKIFKPVLNKKEGVKKEIAIIQLDDALSRTKDSDKISKKGLKNVVGAAADDAQLTRSLRKMQRDLFRGGGRAGYKMGSKCKLATKGKGRAYGKNS